MTFHMCVAVNRLAILVICNSTHGKLPGTGYISSQFTSRQPVQAAPDAAADKVKTRMFSSWSPRQRRLLPKLPQMVPKRRRSASASRRSASSGRLRKTRRSAPSGHRYLYPHAALQKAPASAGSRLLALLTMLLLPPSASTRSIYICISTYNLARHACMPIAQGQAAHAQVLKTLASNELSREELALLQSSSMIGQVCNRFQPTGMSQTVCRRGLPSSRCSAVHTLPGSTSRPVARCLPISGPDVR